ncbi:MAG: hypothetical protein LC793_07055 [Thermomicrobia bacterium]|nr:hypothetical protein [Thermomicrobia bacterium]
MPLASYTATYTGGSSLIDQIRRKIMDIDVDTVAPDGSVSRADWSCIFVDSEILAVSSNYPIDQVNLTAADLLDDIASNAAFLAKRIRIGDYEEDTKTVSQELHAQAEALRHQLDTVPAELITDIPWTDANWGRIVISPKYATGG